MRHIALLALLAMCATDARADIINVPADQPTIQAAINAADTGDEVVIAPGTYNETINMMGKAITLRSTDPEDPDVVAATIIDAQQTGTVITCSSGEGLDTVISGLTVTGGMGTTGNRGGGFGNFGSDPTIMRCYITGNIAPGSPSGGGGIDNYASSPTVTDCTFFMNQSTYGGGMQNTNGSSPMVLSCEFRANIAIERGGGMYNNESSSPSVISCQFIENEADFGAGMRNYTDCNPLVQDCLFLRNRAPTCTQTRPPCPATGGAGMFNTYASPVVLSCIFAENKTRDGGFGGGMYSLMDCSPVVVNCTFFGNESDSGAGIRNEYASALLVNCTIISNEASSFAGGGVLNGFDDSYFFNCVVWGNTPDQVADFGTTTTITHSLIQGGYPGTGNIDADPMFVDADGPDDIPGTEDDDLRLLPGSPCIDAGDNSAVPIEVTTDLDGNPRFVDDPDTIDTGAGTAPIVDMGAYEFQGVCIADADGDNDRDLDDLQLLLFNFGQSVPPYTGGDATGDGNVDLDDLQLLLFHFGTSC